MSKFSSLVQITTATTEHSFITFRQLKTFLCSGMMQTTLNYVKSLNNSYQSMTESVINLKVFELK